MFFKKNVAAEDFGRAMLETVFPYAHHATNLLCHRLYEGNLANFNKETEEKSTSALINGFCVALVELMM